MTRAKAYYYKFDRLCFPVNVYFCPNKAAWDRLMRAKKWSDEYPLLNAKHSGTATNFEDNSIVICLKLCGSTSTEYAGLMMHELMHVIQHIERVAYPLDENGRLDIETQAYLMHGLSMWGLDVMQECGFFEASK